MEQIIRIPNKYGELINTMSDDSCGKLMKALFIGDNKGLDGLTLTYYNIIIIDINNIQNQVDIGRNNGKKGAKYGVLGGRPKGKITPPSVIKNNPPSVIKKTPNIKESKVNKDKVNKDKVNNNITNINNTKNLSLNIINKEIIKQKYNITDIQLDEEIELFIGYWTEPNKKGKQRYEFQQTFEPNRRLTTWLSNNNKWNKKVFVNQEDEERKKKLADLELRKKNLFNNI